MSKARITITVSKDILKKIDEFIDGKSIRNRSHAIENMVSSYLKKPSFDTAIIIAGGSGISDSRGNIIPKAMANIGGAPLLDYHMKNLRKNGIKNIIICAGKNSPVIEKYFGNGSGMGLNIIYLVEKAPMGQIGPIRMATEYIRGTFAVLNADTLFDPNITKIYEFHRNIGASATMLLTTTEDTSHFGVVKMNGTHITEFMEKPKHYAGSKIINAGFYLIEPEIIRYIKNNYFTTEEFFKSLAKTGKLHGFLQEDMVFDVATPDAYILAKKHFNK